MTKRKSMLSIVMTLVFVLVLLIADVSAEELRLHDGLVVWYKFEHLDDIVIVDSSGSGNEGTLNGEARLDAGKDGSALHFNGLNNYINMGSSYDLQPSDITISYWYKRTTSLLGQEGIIVWAKPDGRWDGDGWYLTIKDQAHEPNRPVLFMVNGNTAVWVYGIVDEFYPLNEWVHVAVTLDSKTKTAAIYRNGIAQQVNLTGSPVISATADTKYLGFNSPAYNSGYLSGVIDDFRIYNRALNYLEIQDLAGIKDNQDLLSDVGSSLNTQTFPVTAWDEEKLLEEGGDMVQFKPFKLSQVRLLDGYLKELTLTNAEYLYSLDSDRLLHMFRLTAGIPSNATPLGGWEAPHMEIRGHTMGHYLSACALLYASTGDERIKAKADAIVDELEKCQIANGGGYLSAFPETLFIRLETPGQSAWVPWYTMHKIFAGLYDMYIHAGNEKSLAVLIDLAAWAKGRIDNLSEQQMADLLNVEFGGMNEVLYNLYEITGDVDHLQLAQRFDHQRIYAPLADGQDNLAGLHANTQIPKIIGASRRYELLGDKRYMAICSNFWDLVVKTRSYATGGNSHNEHFGTANRLADTLGNTNHETCNTYNMLRLTRHLFQWTGDAQYADYYERAFLNGILPTMHPETGLKMYFVPMGPGFFKVFHTKDNSFYCCTGTGMESFAKLGDSIYFHRDNELYVNMYIASMLNWDEMGVKIEQRTDFPIEPSTKLIIHTPKAIELAINIRIPYWADNGVTVKINKESQSVTAEPSSYLTLERLWQDGDSIEITMPMKLHFSSLPDKHDRAAFMYGPMVLVGLLGTDNMQITTTGVDVTIPNRGIKRASYLNVLDTERFEIAQWLLPVKDQPLTFKLREDVGSIIFKPFYQVFDQRYGVYWDLTKPEEAVILEPSSEPILWYKFNENEGTAVSDSSGNENAGKLVGGAVFVKNGIQGGAVLLDGINGYVSLPAGILKNVEQVTICTWVYLNSYQTWARIFDFGSGTGINMFLTPQAAGNPQLRFAIATQYSSGESNFGRSNSLPVGQWTHIAVTLDKSNGTLYVDGEVAASSKNIDSYPWEMGNTVNNYIGRSQYPADPFLDGIVDDFRIYNRVLEVSEIKSIYQGVLNLEGNK